MDEVVLSLSFNIEELRQRESALQAHGFNVKSVHSPGQARFEIEMGQCGVFITSDLVPDIVNQDLMELFRKSCPKNGLIILVEANPDLRKPSYELNADITVPKSMDPEGIVDALRTRAESRGRLSA
jgi:DNA-binding NarL/FixJ family response regulator